MRSKIYAELPGLNDDLDQVLGVINKKLESSEEKFSKIVCARFNGNSKLIRSALVLIGASYKSSVKEKALNLAAAIEMLHVASLIHDDIIDEARLRRNLPTINYEYDDGYAVICGDYLFSKSFQLIFETQDLKSISLMGSNVTTMVFGEVEQYLDKYNEKISIERYLAIIEKKTASFFATSLVLGARLAQVNEKESQLLENFGKSLGMLFQIQDDLLDFASVDQIGKSSQSDLKRGTYSLPVIIALNKDKQLIEILQQQEINFTEVLTIINKTKALEDTKEYIQQYYQDCLTILAALTNKTVSNHLKILMEKVLKRNY